MYNIKPYRQMKTTVKKSGKKREYVFKNGLRYIKQSGFLVLDQLIDSIDKFHTYTNKQIL